MSSPAPVPIARINPLLRLGGYFLFVFLFLSYSRMLDLPPMWPLRLLHLPLVFGLAAAGIAVVTGSIAVVLTSRIGWFLMAYTGWLILAVPTSMWPGGSVEKISSVWMESLVLFAMAAALTPSRQQIRALGRTMVVATVALSVFAMLYGSLESGRLYFNQRGRFANPNDLAAALLQGLPFFVLLLKNNRGRYLLHALVLGAMVPVLVVMAKTGSRGGFLGLCVLLLVLFWYAPFMSKLRLVWTVAVGAVLLVVVLPSSVKVRYLSLVDSEAAQESRERQASVARSSAENRQFLLMESLLFTIQNPVLGVGPGMFRAALAADLERRQMWGAHRETHNTFTQVSSEAGIPALVFYLGALYYCFKTALSIFKQRRKQADPESAELANLAFCLLLTLMGYTVTAMFSSLAYGPHLPLVAGMLVSLERLARSASAPAVAMPAAPPAVAGRPWRRTPAGRLARLGNLGVR